jgi:alpha-glucosidase
MWWRDGVLYQIYPRSFADSDGDGVGDLRGIIDHLDHLAWLGIDGLWLNPTFPSPNADWGFDVSDYRAVHPELGTMDDLDELVARAGERDMRVLLDLVPNHTSDEHPWFRERRELYVWRAGRDGGPPNNWKSLFGGPAWTRDDASGDWYLHIFDPKQPDLDWWNEDVRAEFDDILRFWFSRGIAGFRIDVAHGIIKDRDLRDNPEATDDDDEHFRRLGQRPVFSMNRPEVHDVLRRWREVSDPHDAILLGETYVHDLESLVAFYGQGTDELHLAFNFVFLLAEFEVATLAPIVARTEELLPEHAWPVWTLGNHDLARYPTRWCNGDPGLARCALMLLLTLRGTPVLYYGDELSLPETAVPPERVVDPVGLLRDPQRPGRDGARTPMPWSDLPGAGFTRPGVEPWLPFGAVSGLDVASQRRAQGSPLHLTRDLVALRRAEGDLRTGEYAELIADDGLWAYRRGTDFFVALNLGDGPRSVAGRGTIAIATRRERDGETVDGKLALGPGEGVVVRVGTPRLRGARSSARVARGAQSGTQGRKARARGRLAGTRGVTTTRPT